MLNLLIGSVIFLSIIGVDGTVFVHPQWKGK